VQMVKKLLEELLEKYEQGKRPLIKIAENHFPRYFTDGEFKALFHAALKDLEREGFITLVWERFEKDNLLRHIKLNPEKAELLYEKLSRQKPEEKEEHFRKIWANLNDFPGWLYEIKKDMLIEPLFADDAPLIVAALNALSQNNEEIPKRVFSQRYLGDSKLFLKVERKVAALLQKYYFKDIEVSGDAVFSEFGVVNNPVYLHLAGPITLKYPDDRFFDLKGLNYDVAFPAGLTLQFAITDFAAHRVVTVENLTSYYQYVRSYPEDVVLYLGGFAGKMERQFLRKIYEYCLNRGLNIDFYHWGDIDLGGFNIFLHLRRETGIPFKPLWMDLETLLKYQERGMKLTDNYRRKLLKALEDPVYQEFWVIIDRMLALNIRLEQEAIEF